MGQWAWIGFRCVLRTFACIACSSEANWIFRYHVILAYFQWEHKNGGICPSWALIVSATVTNLSYSAEGTAFTCLTHLWATILRHPFLVHLPCIFAQLYLSITWARLSKKLLTSFSLKHVARDKVGACGLLKGRFRCRFINAASHSLPAIWCSFHFSRNVFSYLIATWNASFPTSVGSNPNAHWGTKWYSPVTLFLL